MIITRSWLNEWIDLKNISTQKICETLNNIGLEVDSVIQNCIPKKIVIGKVIECIKHPNADKLSVCQVDIGTSIEQIVCGAKNVIAGLFVPVATIGADLGNAFIIKDTKLRGVESNGMICSAKEIGLPDFGDGILELDDSIGELEIGKELREYPLLNDEIIELELTANRGDCLNIYGIARDLSVPLNLNMKKFEPEIKEIQIGMARALKIQVNELKNSSIKFEAITNKNINLPLLINFRIAIVGQNCENSYEKFAIYATHTTGVLLRVYGLETLEMDNLGVARINIKNDENGIAELTSNNMIISKLSISQNSKNLPNDESKVILVEGNYIEPSYISKNTSGLKIKDSRHYYISTRGSNPNLDFGMKFLNSTIQKYSNSQCYTGEHQIIYEAPVKNIKVELSRMQDIIGQKIDKGQVANILQKLGFELNVGGQDEIFFIKIPSFRHDIINFADIVEEIVRIVGIDNIKSKPMVIREKRMINNSYQEFRKKQYYRRKSARNGFFETMHYFFNQKSLLEKYGFKTIDKSIDLTNPITKELDTLRPTLLLSFLNSASNNIKNGKKTVKFFEIGIVVDENRVESQKLAFLFSGFKEREHIGNSGKPSLIDFFYFAKKISNVLGNFEIKKNEKENLLVNPYEYGEIFQNGKSLGFIARVHLEIENSYDLPPTYICEIDFKKLEFKDKKAVGYSKFPLLQRDLSFLVPKSMPYSQIRSFLDKNLPKDVIDFFPIDIYHSEELGNNMSLTIKFNIQSNEKTLNEKDITSIMEEILKKLKDNLGLDIR